MKKIITIILLLIFCIEPTCWAAEIIVGADGQARYAEDVESMIDPVVENDAQVYVQPQEPVQVKKEVLKQMDNSITTKEELVKKIQPYEKKNKDIIKKAKKNIEYRQAYSQVACLSSNKSIDDKIKTIQLQNGDYALWKPSWINEQYAPEYHQDGSLFGIVKIKKLSSGAVVFYEYRAENEKSQVGDLKHIMIVYDDTHKPAFVYTVENELRCCKYDDKMYAIDLPNLPEISEIDLADIQLPNGNALLDMGDTAFALVQAPFVWLLRLPVMLIFIALYILYLPVGIFMTIKTKNKSWLTFDLGTL